MSSMKFILIIVLISSLSRADRIAKCDFFVNDGVDNMCIVNQTEIIDSNTILSSNEESIDAINIWISGDTVKSLPIHLAQNFPKLVFFRAKYAQFQKVEKRNLEKLWKLTFLVLQSKNLKTVDKNAFEDLESLEILEMSDCSINYFHSATFEPLKMLKFLYIQKNNLQVLHQHAFDQLVNLEVISFAFNKLLTLDRQLFVNKKSLRVIDGRNNSFVYLDEILFDDLHLDELILSGQNGGDCSLYNYGKHVTGFIDMDEVKTDIRDNCKGTDFQIYQVHAKVLEIVKEHADKWN